MCYVITLATLLIITHGHKAPLIDLSERGERERERERKREREREGGERGRHRRTKRDIEKERRREEKVGKGRQEHVCIPSHSFNTLMEIFSVLLAPRCLSSLSPPSLFSSFPFSPSIYPPFHSAKSISLFTCLGLPARHPGGRPLQGKLSLQPPPRYSRAWVTGPHLGPPLYVLEIGQVALPSCRRNGLGGRKTHLTK